MLTTEQEVEAIARSAWPHVASVSVQPIVAGRRRSSEFDPPDSGFTLTACNAEGGIVKQMTGQTLDMLKAKIELQSRKKGRPPA